MHEVTWILIFGSRVRRVANNFHEGWSNEWNHGKSYHEWPKIIINGNECIILFLIRYLIYWTQNSAKSNYPSLISPFCAECGLFWWHNSWSLTSRERRVQALWRHICRLFCTRKLAQRRSSLAPAGIQGLECKNISVWWCTLSWPSRIYYT